VDPKRAVLDVRLKMQELVDAVGWSETAFRADALSEEMVKKNIIPSSARKDSRAPTLQRGPRDVFKNNVRLRFKHRFLGPKRGIAVHFGHENWNMVISMMIGMRTGVARQRMFFRRPLEPADFRAKEKANVAPRYLNMLDSTVSKRVLATRFTDYAPLVFQKIRERFGISMDTYLRAIGPEQLIGNMVLGNLSSLAELSSEGKSGAFFYFTADGRFVIKTITKEEKRLIVAILPSYYEYVSAEENRNTLITRIYGVHSLYVKKNSTTWLPFGKRKPKLYFLVMSNLFATEQEIHRRYDLKGSWIGRRAKKGDSAVVFKDLNFKDEGMKIILGPHRAPFIAQVERDARWLASHNLLDYSLLIGVHEIASDEDLAISGEYECVLSADGQKAYYIGIIDILTEYNAIKRAENVAKTIQYGPRKAKGISCVPSKTSATSSATLCRECV
jgi:hypothetical protein